MTAQQKGVLYTVLGGIFWGLSGVCGQYLFAVKGLNAKWMVTIRLVTAGFVMLMIAYAKPQAKERYRKLWTDWKNFRQLILFSILGMATCQLTYYMAIECSNAGTATVLQYTSPVLLVILMAVKRRKMPSVAELFALVLAVAGTFLLATHGNPGTLALSKEALLWGIGAAISMVLYNLLPVKLMDEFGVIPIMGCGMVIGGIFMIPFTKPWIVPGTWDVETFMGLSVVILVGTILSFFSYFKGMQIVGPARASLFSSSEPLTATVASAVFMHVAFVPADIVGLLCILTAVSVLALQKLHS